MKNLISVAKVATAPSAGTISAGLIAVRAGRAMAMSAEAAADSPVDIKEDFVTDASRLVQALSNCGDQVKVSVGDSRVTLSGNGYRFSAKVIPADAFAGTPVDVSQKSVAVGAGLVEAVAAITPLAGKALSRPELYGITLRGAFIYAHQPHVVVRLPAPVLALDELPLPLTPHAAGALGWRDDNPTDAIVGVGSVTFVYADTSALRLQLLNTTRPQKLFELCNFDGDRMNVIPDGLLKAVSSVAGYAEMGDIRLVHLTHDGLVAKDDVGEAHYDVEMSDECTLDATTLAHVLPHFTHWRIGLPAEPVTLWHANGARGVLVKYRF